MLLKSSITKILIHSDEWHQARLGKLTSSEIFNIMGDKFPTEAAMNYLYRKIGEELSGLPCKDDIDNAATKHGNLYEPEALRLFADMNKLPFLITQSLISPIDSRFSCTPDAIIIKNETQDSYAVETVETKCPYSFDAYIKLFMCENPGDVLKVEKKYFWQVIDQMYICDALMGYLVIYQPMFKAGKIKVIPFRKLDLLPFFKTLKERKELAEAKFIEVRDKLLQA